MTAKILVVDDSLAIQKIVAMTFENEDAILERVSNGFEALARLKTFQPDIVLADADMPGLSGFELSCKIKESSELKDISVLLLSNDFEEINKDLFRASLADDHITKPLKSEDLVRKVSKLLDDGLPVVAVEETEEVIELSLTDRLDEDVVINLGENQLDDSLEGVFSEKEKVDLDFLRNHDLTGLDNEEDGKQGGFTAGDQEENLDALLMKVEELSRKPEEILDNEPPKELSRMEAIDAILKEVSTLKGETFCVDPQEENDYSRMPESRLSLDFPESETILVEVDYISEENAEALETAFDEIANRTKYPALPTEPSESQESICQEGSVVTEPENLTGDFTPPLLTTAHGNPLPDLKKESSPSKGKIIATDASEEIIKTNGTLQLPLTGQLSPLAEIEVRRILQQVLTPLIEKEVSGLSEKIIQTMEENVKKITPSIVKAIIEMAFDKITTKEDS